MEWVETTGDSVTDAKAAALDLLGIAADEAEFEIINEERKNFLGRVKDQARIRARVRPTAPRPKQERSPDKSRGRRGGGRSGSRAKKGGRDGERDGRARSPKRPASSGPATDSRGSSTERSPRAATAAAPSPADPSSSSSSRAETPASSASATMSLDRQGEVMSDFLGGLLRAFELEGRIENRSIDESTLEVNVAGPDLGLMIGPRGNTLQAIQELARTVVQRQSGGDAEGRLRVDIDGYRERRRQALAAFATEVAEKVAETGIEQAFEPMSAADRKIVHDAITEVDGVETVSEGTDPDRRVVVVPAS